MSVVKETRNRQTGTTVQVVDNRDGSFDSDDPNTWFNVCVEHGGVVSHETRRLAEQFAPVPNEWCPTCQDEDAYFDFALDAFLEGLARDFRGNLVRNWIVKATAGTWWEIAAWGERGEWFGLYRVHADGTYERYADKEEAA